MQSGEYTITLVALEKLFSRATVSGTWAHWGKISLATFRKDKSSRIKSQRGSFCEAFVNVLYSDLKEQQCISRPIICKKFCQFHQKFKLKAFTSFQSWLQLQKRYIIMCLAIPNEVQKVD